MHAWFSFESGEPTRGFKQEIKKVYSGAQQNKLIANFSINKLLCTLIVSP